MPVEELCSSASRAAAEATRIGFPVRVSLASPDVRVWDHPDLVVDLIDNAARVREVFGSLMTTAQGRAPEGRLLGVTVTAANQATALLQVKAHPLPQGRVSMELGFADAHGKAAGDTTVAILPASAYAIERALGRLQGNDLVLGGARARRKRNVEQIGDTLLRLAAFINDRVKEVESVELLPLALLSEGGVEVREACVTVSDSFERSVGGAVGPYQERAAPG
jgi:acetyltransferase